MSKRVSVTGHYINFRPSVQAWMACCSAFPAFFAADGSKTGSKGRICSKWSPWSAGCGSCGAKWCFVCWLQFGRNLEELAHGVSPGHADILVLEHEEIAIPRPGLFLPRSAQVLLGWGIRADFPRSAYIVLVIQRKRADHQQLVSSRKRVQNESEESWMPLL